MNFSLAWMADALRAAGLNVVEQAGWQTRGHGDMSRILGVLCHDTVGRPPPDDHSDIVIVQNGRPDLAGPLAQLFLARSGTFYTVAAGKAYHAGEGILDDTQGKGYNSNLIGIEAENMGQGGDPWPPAQIDAFARGCAVLAKHAGFDVAHVLGHKEFACFPDGRLGRKQDPDFDMNAFRRVVATHL